MTMPKAQDSRKRVEAGNLPVVWPNSHQLCSVRACSSAAPACSRGWAELGGRSAGPVGPRDVISGRRGWLYLRWASRAPRRCGLSSLDTGGRKCSRVRLRPPRRCLLRLRGPVGLQSGASLRDSVSGALRRRPARARDPSVLTGAGRRRRSLSFW